MKNVIVNILKNPVLPYVRFMITVDNCGSMKYIHFHKQSFLSSLGRTNKNEMMLKKEAVRGILYANIQTPPKSSFLFNKYGNDQEDNLSLSTKLPYGALQSLKEINFRLSALLDFPDCYFLSLSK